MQKEILSNYDSKPIKYLYKKDKRLGKLIFIIAPLSYLVYHDWYTFLIFSKKLKWDTVTSFPKRRTDKNM